MPHRNSTTKIQPHSTVTPRRSPRLGTKDHHPSKNQPRSTVTPRRSPRLGTKDHHPSKNQPRSTVTPRRSPRVVTKDLRPSEYPKTPDLKSERTRNRYPEVPKRVQELKSGCKSSCKSENGSKRSDETVNGGVCLRRSPRFSGNNSTTTDEFDEKESSSKSNQKGVLNVGKAEVGFNPCKQLGAKIEKRVTRHSNHGINESKQVESVKKITEEGLTTRSSATKKGKGNGVIRSGSTGIVDEEDFIDVERAKVSGNLCKEFGRKLEKRAICSYWSSLELVGGEGKEEGDLDKGMKLMGVKRKRNQVEEGHGVDKGWTKDQEMALQRAYFSAKPTPLFWKKVAKLVPGKSAKDCFNKLHSDHSTPPQPRIRLKSRKTNSPSSLSASILLKPEEPITKKKSCRKQSRHLAQKTVRQLLQKHYNVDQNYEADLFSVLESTMNPSTQALQKGLTRATPGGEHKDSGYLKKCHERSSSAHHAKHISRLSGSYGAILASPPVLKPVKNKALHEKYIDQLHCREAKRRVAKVIKVKENRKESCINIQKTDVIKAAKDALVFDSKDVIHQFNQVKVSGMGNLSDFDDDFVESDDYEAESEP